MSNKLINDSSIEWAVDFIMKHSDGDLFPKTMEMCAIAENIPQFIKEIQKSSEIPLIGQSRRFIVPKDELSYRQATQLYPQDSIILTALVYQYGQGIEDRRVPKNIVYSYRFSSKNDKELYSSDNGYEKFWNNALCLCKRFGYVLYCDIADFYNQIYHHLLENQLTESGFPNQASKWILRLLNSTTANVSRGIPVGPHATHILSEAAMIPIDNSLMDKGIRFLRYADDILIFCKSEAKCKIALYEVAATLDKQQRLMLQRHKTKILNYKEFEIMHEKVVSNQTDLEEENIIYGIINKYSNGDPYQAIAYEDISEEDRKQLTEEVMADIIDSYLSQENIDYGGLRWFYKRLAQIGHPGAVSFTLEVIEKLTPCFPQVCTYLGSVQSVSSVEWKFIGTKLLALLENELIMSNEYLKLLVLSLFSRNPNMNHFSSLSNLFNRIEPFGRREIILAARANKATDWLRELKELYQVMDAWQKSAFLYSLKSFPKDERKFFISNISTNTAYETVIANWVRQ